MLALRKISRFMKYYTRQSLAKSHLIWSCQKLKAITVRRTALNLTIAQKKKKDLVSDDICSSLYVSLTRVGIIGGIEDVCRKSIHK